MTSVSSTSSTSSPSVSTNNVSDRKGPIKLANNPAERQKWDNLGNLYSIIKTCELLEKAYAYKAIDDTTYRKECSLLIDHFKTTRKLTGLETNTKVVEFMREYRLECPLAYHTLVELGVPRSGALDDTRPVVAQTVQHFITLMDSLKLSMTAVDQIHPLIAELLESINKLRVEFANKDRLSQWLVKLNGMKASDELVEADIRQLAYDLDLAYSGFHKSLQ